MGKDWIPNYKVGDKVKIVKDNCRNGLTIGTEYKIERIVPECKDEDGCYDLVGTSKVVGNFDLESLKND
jgi:hypothetical protein